MYANDLKRIFYSRLGRCYSVLASSAFGDLFFLFFSPHVNVITAAQRVVAGATCFPLVSAAVSSKSGMSSKWLQWESRAFGNLWAITGVWEAWSAVRGWSDEEPRSSRAAQRETNSSPRQLLDDSCREEKVIPCAYLWSFKPEQRLPPVRPPSSACKSKSWAELLDHLRHREAPLLSSERFGVGSSDSVDVFVFLLINCLKGVQSKDSDKDGPLSPQKRHWMCKSVLSYLLWGDKSLLSSNNFVSAVANLFHSHCEEFESKNLFL